MRGVSERSQPFVKTERAHFQTVQMLLACFTKKRVDMSGDFSGSSLSKMTPGAKKYPGCWATMS